MHYKCPLCLKKLDQSQRLQRFCTIHDKVDDVPHIFSGTMTNLRSREAFCRQCTEESEETVNEGIFLRHLECIAENPFWDESAIQDHAEPDDTVLVSSLPRGKVVMPGEKYSNTIPFQLDFGVSERRVSVRHWLLGILGRLPDNVKEMWFPLMMLRATNELRRFKRIGKLVELVGPQGSGKTILAILSANTQGWNLNNKSANVDLNNYIYSNVDRLNPTSLNRYIETLHFWSLLHDNNKNGLFLPQGTFGDGHLKTCFIKPNENLALPDSYDESSPWEKIKLRGKNKRIKVWAGLKNLFSFTSNNYPFWYSVIFYDSSGENVEQEKSKPELSSVDLVAIVLNATDLFDIKTATVTSPPEDSAPTTIPVSYTDRSSLRVAWQRIQQGFQRKKRCFLVVTQLDRIKEQIGTEDWEKIGKIVNDFNYDKDFKESKALLKKWLGKTTNDDNADDLATYLHRIDKVFFVWTENLPQYFEPQPQDRMPASHGITKFMCACLNIDWKAICKGE